MWVLWQRPLYLRRRWPGSSFAGDDLLAVPPKTLCGTSTDIGMIYTEIILKKENTIMNNIIKLASPQP